MRRDGDDKSTVPLIRIAKRASHRQVLSHFVHKLSDVHGSTFLSRPPHRENAPLRLLPPAGYLAIRAHTEAIWGIRVHKPAMVRWQYIGNTLAGVEIRCAGCRCVVDRGEVVERCGHRDCCCRDFPNKR